MPGGGPGGGVSYFGVPVGRGGGVDVEEDILSPEEWGNSSFGDDNEVILVSGCGSKSLAFAFLRGDFFTFTDGFFCSNRSSTVGDAFIESIDVGDSFF